MYWTSSRPQVRVRLVHHEGCLELVEERCEIDLVECRARGEQYEIRGSGGKFRTVLVLESWNVEREKYFVLV